MQGQGSRKTRFHQIKKQRMQRFFITLSAFLVCLFSAPNYAQEYRAVVTIMDDDLVVIPFLYTPPPAPPTILNGSQSDSDAIVTWNASPDAESYQLEWFNPDTGLWERVYSGIATTYTLSNLPYGSNQFRVKACANNHCGEVSITKTVAVNLLADTGSNSVGALQGEGGVSGGAAFYNIPIVVPPGRKGVQPSVLLNYSSRGGNGVAGMGWSLSASSSIHRCSATVAQDSFTASVQYHPNRDRLCLNGQRLMNVSGVYGANGAEYRTELDQFARIKQFGVINSTASYFTVEFKDGTIGYYGTTTPTRHKDAGRNQIMTWAIAYSKDRSGNSIHYDYSNHSEGENLLNAIHYTGTNNTAGNRHVRFTYEVRPDPSSRFLAGGKSRQTKRLKQIKTEYSGTPVRTYTLDYGTVSTSSQRSLLRGVRECAFKSGVQHCLPSTTFNWQESSPQFTFERLQFENSNGSTSVVHDDKRWIDDVMPRGDVNGDGVRDWPGFYVNAEGQKTGTHNNTISNCYKRANSFSTNCLEADFDSDGRTDSFKRDVASSSLAIKHANNSTWITTNITWPSSSQSYPIGFSDFNGDGWIDVAFREAVLGATAQLWIYTHTKNKNVPYVAADKKLVADIAYSFGGYVKEYQIHGDVDGNGYADFIEFDTSPATVRPAGLPYPVKIIKVSASSSGVISFSDLNFTGYTNTPSINANYFHDINGDGLTDWLSMVNSVGLIHYKLNNGNGFDSNWTNLGLTLPVRTGIYEPRPSEFEPYTYPIMSKVLSMDYNGDGKQDVLVAGAVQASSCHSVQPDGWKCDEDLYGTFQERQRSLHEAQINSAILDDSARNYQALKFVENANGTISVAAQNTNITASASQAAVLDATGDGLPDVITVFGCRFPTNCEWNSQTGGHSGTVQNGSIVAGAYINRNRGASTTTRYEAHDMMKSATTGLGVQDQWTYRPLSSDQYDRSNSDFYQTTHNAQENDFDYFHFASSMYVVAEQKSSNGIGGLNSTKYRYRGAIYNNKGRGFQGFKSIITESDANGSDSANLDTISRTDYQQKWPLSGISTQSCTWLANDNKSDDNPSCGGVLSKSVTNTVQNVATAGGARFVSPKNTTETRYKLSNRSLLGTTTTTRSFDAAGNVALKIQVYEDDYTKVTSRTADTMSLDWSGWWLNRLTAREVRNSPVQKRHNGSPSVTSGTDNTKITTTHYHSYHSTLRLPTSVTISANDSSLSSTVTTQYTSRGLPKLVSTTGTSVTGPRTVTTTYSKNGSSTDEDGYFVRSVKNALNHTSSMTTDPKIGQVLSQTDINGLVSTNSYDAFGRIESVNAPGVPNARTRYRWCSSCPTNGKYKVTAVQSGSPDVVVVKDKFSRDIVMASRAFSTRKHNLVKTTYNHLGQITFESTPYSASNLTTNNTIGTRYNAYDALGRLTQKSVDQAAGWEFVTDYSHDGYKTNISATSDKVINGARVPTTLNLHRIYNGLEQLMETKDANNGYTRYAYDGSGNPIVMQDANGNNIIARFNAFGHKQYVNDPNMGRKDFTYNALGEVLTETDANDQTQSYSYDALGRMIRRKVNDVVNGRWLYDNVASDKGLGLLDYEDNLSQSDGSRLRKFYYYSAASTGRKALTKVRHRIYSSPTSSTDYDVDTAYDATFGRVTRLTYPTGLELGFGYNYHGYLTQEIDTASNQIYRRIDAMDARNLVTSSKLANGRLIETVDYAQQTGQMRGIQVSKGSALKHSLNYLYDGFGDMHYRETIHGLDRAEERFEYDSLHRITKSTRQTLPAIGSTSNVAVNYGYDAIGNLTLKSDYANGYSYNTSRPNAVNQVTLAGGGTTTFAYDNNGNMTTGQGKILSYNVFNKPSTITTANSSSTFQYGADTQRYKKEETGTNNKTTLYIGKLMEVVTEGTTVKKKVYIGGTAIVTETKVGSAASTTQTHYLLKGRLGSTITVTDELGDVIETNGFDVFGKPRTGLWQDKTEPVLDSQITTRGYTGHEHLDESQLIHMNGRAYDYNLGRFLSVDPFIQEPGNSQSMNPYSYLMNNPLSGTDPTGFKGVPEEQKEVTVKIRPERKAQFGSRIKKETGNKVVSIGFLSAVVGGNATTSQIKAGLSNGGSNSQGSSSMGANATAGDNSISNVGSQQQRDEKPDALASLGGATRVLVGSFKTIARDAIQRTKDQFVGAETLIDISGIEAGLEAGISASEGDLSGAAIAGGGIALGKLKTARTIGNTVIGKVDDLIPEKLLPGEKTLLSKLPDQGSPRANWMQNSSVLRQELRKGQPIRDASAHLPDSHPRVKGTFLGAERNLMRNKGWRFDTSSGFWNPPN